MPSHRSARYTSEELFHFVGRANPSDDAQNYEVLRTVLEAGWISYPPHRNAWEPERIQFNPTESLLAEGMIVPQVVCLCDIPIEALAIHVAKYGRFGFSLTREYVMRYGARPVMYFPVNVDKPEARYGTPCLKDMEVVFRSLREHLNAAATPRDLGVPLSSLGHAAGAFAGIALREFLAYLKPFDSRLSQSDPQNYYMEREWRRLGNIGFGESDVRTIIVPASHVDRARSELKAYARKIQVLEAVLH